MVQVRQPAVPAVPRFGATFQRQVLPDHTTVETYDDIVILSGARTPFAKVGGSLRDVSAFDLLKVAMKGAMEKAGIRPEDVSQVIAGNIIGNHEQAAFLVRNVELALGIPQGATALAINRLCGTGFEAIRQAAGELSNGGEDRVILTGGVENMSQTPVMDNKRMLVEGYLEGVGKKGGLRGKLISKAGKAQQGWQRGTAGFENPLQKGLTDPHADIMIATADRLAALEGISADQANAFAARSQQRAALAQSTGLFDDEIVPVRKDDLTREGPWRSRLQRGAAMVTADEHIRPGTTAEKLKKLEVINKNMADAIHTAGTSSGVVDGAAAVAVSTGQFAKAKHLPVLARLKAVAISGCDPNLMGIGPVKAIRAVLDASHLSLDDVDMIEVNEAFAGQTLAVAKRLGIPYDKLNVDGGAIAIGHPLSASGSRITTHAANRLKMDNKRLAVVSACIGGGQGIAMLIENPEAPEKPAQSGGDGGLYPPDRNCWDPRAIAGKDEDCGA